MGECDVILNVLLLLYYSVRYYTSNLSFSELKQEHVTQTPTRKHHIELL